MFVSVIICTWNRAKLLEQTLDTLRAVEVPPGVTWELLVVNNNCTDDTAAVVSRFADTLPLRPLFEPKQGLSNARNCAIEHARGDLLIWTDDDVLVEPCWLAAYVQASGDHPEVGYFGGPIRPWFETDPPWWVKSNLKRLEPMLVIRDYGASERPFQEGETPFGANMAVRTRVLAGARFDPNLGKSKDECILAEETALFNRLHRDQIRGIWLPRAELRHFVTTARLTRDYLWKYFHGMGRTVVRTGGFEYQGEATLWGVPRWLYQRYWAARADSIGRRLLGRDWVEAFTTAALRAGMIHEIRLQKAASRQASPFPDAREGGGVR